MEAWLQSLLSTLALPEYGLSTVFVVSLISATLLPLGSEPAVFGLVKLNADLFWPAILVATAGNTIGGAISWAMGYGAEVAYERVTHKHVEAKALKWLERFGAKACLLALLLPLVMMGITGAVLVYEAADGSARVDVRLERETVWLTQRQMAELHARRANITVDEAYAHMAATIAAGRLGQLGDGVALAGQVGDQPLALPERQHQPLRRERHVRRGEHHVAAGFEELPDAFAVDDLGLDASALLRRFLARPVVGGVVFGVILVLMMLLRPEGIIPNRQRQEELHDADPGSGDAMEGGARA